MKRTIAVVYCVVSATYSEALAHGKRKALSWAQSQHF